MSRWPMRPLGELGSATDGDWILTADYQDEGVRLLQVGDVGVGQFIGKSHRYISKQRAMELKCTFLKTGDLLISRLPDPLGRACIYPGLSDRQSITAVDVTIFRSDRDTVTNEFLAWYLNSSMWFREVLRYATGTTRPRISRKRLEALLVPVPPLHEQERIVRLLDEADAIRQLRVQADQRTAELIPALFHQMFGDPVTNPMGWPVMQFGELCKNRDGKRRPVKASDREQMAGIYPYYGASGIIDYVNGYLFDEPALLIAEDGANLITRSTPIAFQAEGRYWVNNHAHIVTENSEATIDFLQYALELRDLRDFITGSAQPKLNQANLNRIEIAVPPRSLQQEFSERISIILGLGECQRESGRVIEAEARSQLSALIA